VELWFAKVEPDVIARDIFTSVTDLKRKLMRYIRHYNKTPRTVKWKYFDPTRRITSTSVVTVHRASGPAPGCSRQLRQGCTYSPRTLLVVW
jgi:hypothetical protein